MADFEHWMDGLPSGSAISDAIDVVAGLTEQAEQIAGNGDSERAMSQALGAAFGYMVAYLHHLTIDRREPRDALARAAAGLPELGAAEMDFLQAAFRILAPRAM